MAERLSVLHVAAPAEVGGLERVVQSLAIGHLGRGHDIQVAAILGVGEDTHPFLPPLQEAGVPVHRLHIPRRGYLAERRAIRRLCEGLSPQVLHSHSERTDVLDAPVARSAGAATVTTIHGASFMGGKASLYEWLQRRSYRRFDAVVAVSDALFAMALRDGVSPDRLHLAPNAWDGQEPLPREAARRELGLPSEGAVVGFVGRLIPVKAAPLFVAALAKVADLDVRGAIVGDGPEAGTVRGDASRLGIAERLTLAGQRNYAFRYLKAFDVFVLCSHSEGTPIVLLEAMGASVPIVATRVGGVPAVLGEDGALLVAPGDASALASAVRSCLLDPDSARIRATRAAERLRREYGVDQWLDRYEAVYRSGIERRAS